MFAEFEGDEDDYDAVDETPTTGVAGECYPREFVSIE